MHDNTPPRIPEIEDDEGELVHFDNDDLPPEDDELEMEEVTLEELEARLGVGGSDDDEYDDGAMGGHRSPVQDDAVLTFQKHTAPVFGCALHPQRDLAATGGEDDRAFVWHTQTGAVVHEINEHKDTVTEVHWSHCGTYLATGDMAGELMVHKLVEAAAEGEAAGGALSLRKVWDFSMGDMAWLRWHRGASVLIAGSDNGEVYVWRIPSGDCKILPGQGARCETGALAGDGKKLFTGYINGVLKLWDLKTCEPLMVVDEEHPQLHQEGVTAIACDKESPLYMSGGPDGKILFSSGNGPVGSVLASGPVECVSFSPSSELKIAASGTLNGHIEIWDFAKHTLRIRCEHLEADDGITKMKWLSDYTLLVATIQGNIYAYDVRSGARKLSLSGHMADVYEFDYDARESILLSASEDHSAKIFKVPQLGD